MQAQIDSRLKLDRLFDIKSAPPENILSTGTLDPVIKKIINKLQKKKIKKKSLLPGIAKKSRAIFARCGKVASCAYNIFN
jgi:hypothetical protein